jgi:hypothetical protein
VVRVIENQLKDGSIDMAINIERLKEIAVPRPD